MFTRIADRYDLLNRILTVGLDRIWRQKAVECLPPDGRLVVDIGVGTGDFAFYALQRYPQLFVLGVDLSEKMLRKSRAKLNSCRYFGLLADALNLPLRDQCADAVLCGFTVRNFENLHRGLSEMARILKPGGRALILEFAPVSPAWHRSLYGLLVRYGVPLVGRLFSEAMAYRYLSLSIKQMEPPDGVTKALIDAGFRSVSYGVLAFGFVVCFLAIR